MYRDKIEEWVDWHKLIEDVVVMMNTLSHREPDFALTQTIEAMEPERESFIEAIEKNITEENFDLFIETERTLVDLVTEKMKTVDVKYLEILKAHEDVSIQ